jgi:hypothetical protein
VARRLLATRRQHTLSSGVLRAVIQALVSTALRLLALQPRVAAMGRLYSKLVYRS